MKTNKKECEGCKSWMEAWSDKNMDLRKANITLNTLIEKLHRSEHFQDIIKELCTDYFDLQYEHRQCKVKK